MSIRSAAMCWLASRWAPAIATVLLTVLVLLPGFATVEMHHDELEYVWSADYFGGKLAHLDFSPNGPDAWRDPGWTHRSFWTQTQPMGTRFIIAVALGLTGAEPPAFTETRRDTPGSSWLTEVSPDGRMAGRIAAILSAAAGLGVIALRLGWPALPASGLFLAIPHIPDDLIRAWAEGPLLLGFGLCVLAAGSRWFPVACAVAATCKLNALAVWPLLLVPRLNGGFRPIRSILLTMLIWTVLTPPSWLAGGPAFLGLMFSHRADAFAQQSATYPVMFGLYIPTRYIWPVELGVLLLLSCLAARYLPGLLNRWRPAVGFGRAMTGAAVRR